MLAHRSSTQDIVPQQMIVPKCMEPVSNLAENRPSSSKKLKSNQRVGKVLVQAFGEKSNDVVQDQIIIAPEVRMLCKYKRLCEIMNIILGQLDMRSLKKCRLVCKSWLQEVHVHMDRRAVVRFQREGFSARMKAFKETRQRKLLPARTEPFFALDADLDVWDRGNFRYKYIMKQLYGILRSSLVLTRFSPGDIPLQLTFPLIIKFSWSLEYLQLTADCCETGYIPEIDPGQSFPKLRQVFVRTRERRQEDNSVKEQAHFPSLVAGIVNTSPKLESFAFWFGCDVELDIELLLGVDIKNVKALDLFMYDLTWAASMYLGSIPFSRLEHLKLRHFTRQGPSQWTHLQTVDLMAKSADTLKELDLKDIEGRADHSVLETFKPLVFRNVEELLLITCRYWKDILPNTFPSLRILSVTLNESFQHNAWTALPTFYGIKTLKASGCHGYNDKLSINFLEKFPALERLELDFWNLRDFCTLMATADARASNILERLKHLGLKGDSLRPFGVGDEAICSSLTAFRGLETIWVSSNSTVLCMPFQDLPCLKVIQFPWGEGLNLDKLLEIARKVETVVLTNCCSVPTGRSQQSKQTLKSFLDSAPNVVCGCGKAWK